MIDPDFKKAEKLLEKIEALSFDERGFILGALILDLADESNMTIREFNESMTILCEEQWASLGADISKPPRKGGAD